MLQVGATGMEENEEETQYRQNYITNNMKAFVYICDLGQQVISTDSPSEAYPRWYNIRILAVFRDTR
jgi:hypothetical protein